MRWTVAVVLVALAGCLETAPEPDSLPPEPVILDSWSGDLAVGEPIHLRGECAGSCLIVADVPPLPPEGLYALRVAWDGTQIADMTIEASGVLTRGFDDVRLVTREPGPYTLHGHGALDATLSIIGPSLRSMAGPELRPNIVTYAPVQVGFGACQDVEQQEQGAQRCLRLGNAIGNTGDGPLQAMLPVEDGALAATGLGSFDQRILLESGGHQDHPVGNADFHLSHAHFHYDGFARFSLYAWDEATGLRGELAAQHKKSGFCFLDWGPMQEPDRAPTEGGRAEQDCLVPSPTGWSMGVSEGWFDFYWSSLADQYVDVAGVPDGTYELVSSADWNDSLLETDETDNSASVVLRLAGDHVEVLESRGHFVMPDDTRQL